MLPTCEKLNFLKRRKTIQSVGELSGVKKVKRRISSSISVDGWTVLVTQDMSMHECQVRR